MTGRQEITRISQIFPANDQTVPNQILVHISNYIKFNVFPTKVRHISEILHKTAYWCIYPEYLLYWLKQYGLDNEIWIICTEWTWLTEGHS